MIFPVSIKTVQGQVRYWPAAKDLSPVSIALFSQRLAKCQKR